MAQRLLREGLIGLLLGAKGGRGREGGTEGFGGLGSYGGFRGWALRSMFGGDRRC